MGGNKVVDNYIAIEKEDIFKNPVYKLLLKDGTEVSITAQELWDFLISILEDIGKFHWIISNNDPLISEVVKFYMRRSSEKNIMN